MPFTTFSYSIRKKPSKMWFFKILKKNLFTISSMDLFVPIFFNFFKSSQYEDKETLTQKIITTFELNILGTYELCPRSWMLVYFRCIECNTWNTGTDGDMIKLIDERRLNKHARSYCVRKTIFKQNSHPLITILINLLRIEELF